MGRLSGSGDGRGNRRGGGTSVPWVREALQREAGRLILLDRVPLRSEAGTRPGPLSEAPTVRAVPPTAPITVRDEGWRRRVHGGP